MHAPSFLECACLSTYVHAHSLEGTFVGHETGIKASVNRACFRWCLFP